MKRVGEGLQQWHGALCQAHGRFAGGADRDSGAEGRSLPTAGERARGSGRAIHSLAVMAPPAINNSAPLQSRIQKPFHELN